MSDRNNCTIVIDDGFETKAGFSKDRMPITIFPTFPSPMKFGIVTNWDNMEKIWHQTFYEALRVAPEEHPVLLTETPLNPKANREKSVQIMFETFNLPALQISVRPMLSLYGSGRTTGMVLESGHDISHTTPVFQSYALPHAILRLEYGGVNVTDYLSRLLNERGYSHLHTDTVRDIKEKLAYVSPYNRQQKDTEIMPEERHYQLPDGQVIHLDKEMTQCTETLFQPSLLSLKADECSRKLYPLGGVHQSLNTSITKCDRDILKHLYGNIVLSGGNTLFPGFCKRLEEELSSLTSTSVRVMAPAERRYLAWIGGATLTSLSSFSMKWTLQEYDESGPSLDFPIGLIVRLLVGSVLCFGVIFDRETVSNPENSSQSSISTLYHLLIDGDRFSKCDGSKIFPYLTQNEARPVSHHLIGKYFSHFNGSYYQPISLLQQLYSDDEGRIKSFISVI